MAAGTETGNELRLEKFADLPSEDRELIEFAEDRANYTFNPLLQRWAVGVAVRINRAAEAIFRSTLRRLGATGVRRGIALMVGGSNAENPDTVSLCECGEDIALGVAQGFGVGDYCEKVAIVAQRDEEEFDYIALPPCVVCRGRIRAYATRSGIGDAIPILLASKRFRDERARVLVTTLAEIEQKIPFSSRGINVYR